MEMNEKEKLVAVKLTKKQYDFVESLAIKNTSNKSQIIRDAINHYMGEYSETETQLYANTSASR